MAERVLHPQHSHVHGEKCGHVAIRHQSHVDYLHDGHLHAMKGSQAGECTIAVDSSNPDRCTPQHACASHDATHQHGPGCGHESVPHGSHYDYLVAGHLHHPHGGHCDHHGDVIRA